jgi:AbrB family looped-hinge helix DNA binding protein
MFTGTFITKLSSKNHIDIPSDVRNRLKLEEGDKVEITIKRIRSRRLEINISKNPLIKLLQLSEEEKQDK